MSSKILFLSPLYYRCCLPRPMLKIKVTSRCLEWSTTAWSTHIKKKNLDGKKTVQNKTELRPGVYRGARWGVRGIEDLGGGYSVGFVLDAGFKDDNGQQTMGRLFGRESSLNVKGPFGELYFRAHWSHH